MCRKKLKFFIAGSNKFDVLMNGDSGIDDQKNEMIKEKSKKYEICCENITKWLLEEGHEIHVAVAIPGHADYSVIKQAEKICQDVKDKETGRIALYLHTAKNDDTEKKEPNPEKIFVKKNGYYKPNRETVEWGIVHEKIIKDIDVVLVIGGGKYSPEIAACAIKNKKIVLNLSMYSPELMEYGAEVINTFLAPFYRNMYKIGEDVISYFDTEYMDDGADKNEFMKRIDTIAVSRNMNSTKYLLSKIGYVFGFLIICAMWNYGVSENIMHLENKILFFFSSVLGGSIGSLLKLIIEKENNKYAITVEYFWVRLIDGVKIGAGVAIAYLFIFYFITDNVIANNVGVGTYRWDKMIGNSVYPITFISFILSVSVTALKYFYKIKTIFS